MVDVSGYLFAVPQNGTYLVGFVILLVVAFVGAVTASIQVHRSRYSAVRRRARRLRSICRWFVVPGALYLLARYQDVDFFNRRIWLYLILGIFLTRLAHWIWSLRSLSVDKVDERERQRKGLYRRGRSRRPTRRKRR